MVKACIDWKINDTLTFTSALGCALGPRGEDRKDLTASLSLSLKFKFCAPETFLRSG